MQFNDFSWKPYCKQLLAFRFQLLTLRLIEYSEFNSMINLLQCL